MALNQAIRDRMIPIENYATISPGATLREAALALRKTFRTLEDGMHTQVGPRTVLVTDENDTLVGILDFMCFLQNYFPQIGGLPETLVVRDIMLRIRGSIDADAGMEDGFKMVVQQKITVLPVYKGGTVVGLIRDTDIFLAITDPLEQGS